MASTTRSRLAPAGLLLLLTACTTRMEVPVEVPHEDPSEAWAQVLGEAAGPDGVDYDLIERHRDILETYLAWVGEHGELSDGFRESQEDRRIAFLVNAYNAAVIYGVLEHRPLDSVRDVDVGVLRHPGAGFFVGLRFRVDGEWTSLHNLEQQRIVDRYQEPLVHVALSCASASCPPVQWWSEKGLQSKLRSGMRRFLASERGLAPVLDEEGRTVGWAANQIFRWYAHDFTDWTEADTVCAWMAELTSGERRDWLREHTEDCPLSYQPYDWSLNAAPATGTAPAPAAQEEGEEEAPAHDADTGDEE